MPTQASRRDFLAAVGAVAVVGAAPATAEAQRPLRAPRAGTPMGLADREDILIDPALTYLQVGSLGPSPRPVLDRTMAVWRALELDPAGQGYGALEQAMEGVRAKAAAFLGCETDELVLTTCTTAGINSVAHGMVLSPGERIITTDQEHPGGRVGWDWVARRQGVQLDIVSIPPGENDPGAVVDRFARLITPKTRALMFSHVLTSSGFRMPVAELSALARRHGLLSIVDGAQAAGGIAVNVKALGCHVYATSGHKWMLGPKGTGMLYISREAGDRIDPIGLQSGRQAYTAATGVGSIPSVHGLAAAIDYLRGIGIDRIEAYNLSVGRYLYDALQGVPQVRVVSAPPGPLASPLLTFQLPARVSGGQMHQRLLEKHRIQVKAVPGNFLNGTRISTHLFNTPRDIDTLIAALKAELA